MSRWIVAADAVERSRQLAPSYGAQRSRNSGIILRCPSFIGAVRLTALCALAVAGFGFDISYAHESDSEVAQVSEVERAGYAEAVRHCRGDIQRPVALSDDKRVLCLDGDASDGQDLSLAKELQENGLFVVRNAGRDWITAIALADLLKEKGATVVIYDYCLSTCASFLQFASKKTYILKDSLVAWGYAPSWPWCSVLEPAADEGPKRLDATPCSDAPTDFKSGVAQIRKLIDYFYLNRAAGPPMQSPPQSAFVRKRLKSMFEGTGRYPEIYWTWNPRYYANTIRTKVVYESYPRSQDEADALAARLGIRVLYDP